MTVPSAPAAPAFQAGAPFLLIVPLVIAAAILAFAGGRGVSVFKKQGVAWGLTALMIVAAIGIGYAKASVSGPTPEAAPRPTAPVSETVPPVNYVRDDAGVLSYNTLTLLDQRNQRLYNKYSVVIGVITCNYGRDDLYDYALRRAEELDLRDYDMLVVLDIKGKTYGMIQGAALVDDFTDDDCDQYARDYMGNAFDSGDYDSAVRDITEMLELWYGIYFG